MKFKKILSHLESITPTLLALSFVLSFYINFQNQASISNLIIPSAIAIFSVLSIEFIISFFLKEKEKRLIFICSTVLAFFTFSEIFKNKLYCGIIFSAMTILVFFVILKADKNLKEVSKYFVLFSLFMFFSSLFFIIGYKIQEGLIYPQVNSPLILNAENKKENLPDIYYIVPDSYTSSKALKQYFNYDNSEFIDFLSKKGFYVTTDSRSNYPKTYLSIASTLNMEYLDYLSVFKNSDNQNITSPLINDNNVKKFLKKQGYKYYQMGSWWETTSNNPYADKNYNQSVNFFQYLLLQSTAINAFMENVNEGIFKEKQNSPLYQFEKMPEIIKKESPKFVFVHIIAPHTPYMFGKNCELLGYKDYLTHSEEENYTNQINCINSKLETAIDQIITNSKKPPIILIQSDEGVPFLREELPQQDSWKDASDDILKEKFPIFSAYYMPDASTSNLYPSISNVNAFRVILNSYFSTNLPLLEDKNYIIPDLKHLYDFIDVTNRVK
ncbi:MAG: sulfatase-like hydrolase/transferase [Candidatus Paceibacterota bacterium]